MTNFIKSIFQIHDLHVNKCNFLFGDVSERRARNRLAAYQ